MLDNGLDSCGRSCYSISPAMFLDWKLWFVFTKRHERYTGSCGASLGSDQACAPVLLSSVLFRTPFRQNSAWNNCELFKYIIRALCKAVSASRETVQIVLLMDSLPIHIADAVQSELKKALFLPLIMPPGTTGKLQIPDTHIFSPFKAELREQCDRLRSRLKGDMSMPAALYRVTFVTSFPTIASKDSE